MQAMKSLADLLIPAQVLRRRPLAGALACVGLGLVAATGSAQTRFTPGPAQVVLPASVQSIAAGNSALREAERDWRRAPKDIDVALRYARTTFLIGLNEGDLRWFGSAKAALLPWWDVKQAVKETLRCADMGLKGININSDPQTFTTSDGSKLPDFSSEYWNPMWEA